MDDLSRFLIRPELRLRNGRIIPSIADAVAYMREHELRPGVDTRDEILHRLERAKTKNELEAAAEAFLSWLEGLDLIAMPLASEPPLSEGSTKKRQALSITETARELASEVGERIKAGVADQKAIGADYVAGIADTLRRASREFDSQVPQAGQLMRTAARQIDNVSDALRTRDATQLASDAQEFARRQPAAVLGLAVLTGFAAVRFFKSSGQSAT
jgi:hypothetical protein